MIVPYAQEQIQDRSALVSCTLYRFERAGRSVCCYQRLPKRDNEFEYQIKSVHEPRDCIVRERVNCEQHCGANSLERPSFRSSVLWRWPGGGNATGLALMTLLLRQKARSRRSAKGDCNSAHARALKRQCFNRCADASALWLPVAINRLQIVKSVQCFCLLAPCQV